MGRVIKLSRCASGSVRPGSVIVEEVPAARSWTMAEDSPKRSLMRLSQMAKAGLDAGPVE